MERNNRWALGTDIASAQAEYNTIRTSFMRQARSI